MFKAMMSAILLGTLSLNTVQAANRAAPMLEQSDWVLQSLAGWQGRLPTKPQPTLAFKGKQASGSDGCNQFNAQVQMPRGRSQAIRIQMGPSTMMACTSPEANRVSSLYSTNLSKAQRYQIKNNQLTLLDARGRPLATFKKAMSELPETDWQVTGYYDGRAAFVSSLNSERMTASFNKDGVVNGYAGCNNYTAYYQIDPTKSKIHVGAPNATKMHCPGADVMKEEQQFLKALQSSTTYKRMQDKLEIYNANGMRVLGFQLAH